MAEVVGLISAIGAITAAAFKITKVISTVRDDLDVAASSVKAILDDTKAVSFILRQIQSRIRMAGHVDSDTKRMLDEILPRCKEDIDDIERTLLPLISTSGQPMSRRQRLRCLFADSKICSQQAALSSLKLTLSMFISTLQLSDGFAIEHLKEEILDAITKTAEIKATFLNAEKVDQAAAQVYSTEESTDDRTCDDAQSTTATGSTSVLALDEDGSETSLSLAGDRGRGFGNGINSPGGMQLSILKQSDFEIAYNLSDDSYLWIAAHLTLQKSVTAFARLAIEHHDQPPEAFEEPPASTETIREEGVAVGDATGAENDDTRRVGTKTPENTTVGAAPAVPSDDASQASEESHENNSEAAATTASDPDYHDGAPPRVHRQRSSRDHSGEYLRSSQASSDHPQQRQSQHPQYPDPNDYGRAPEPRGFNNYAPYYGGPPFAQDYPPQPGSRPGFYGPPFQPNTSGPFAQGHYFNPYQAPQGYFPPYETVPGSSPDAVKEDPEKEKMRMQLLAIRAAQEKREAQELQKEREMRIRRDAEENFHRRMEEMRRAQEEAKAEIEMAKIQAEKNARERLEAEREAKLEIEREKREAEKVAEKVARERLEAELKAERQNQSREDRLRELEEQLKEARDAKKRSFRASLFGRGA